MPSKNSSKKINADKINQRYIVSKSKIFLSTITAPEGLKNFNQNFQLSDQIITETKQVIKWVHFKLLHIDFLKFSKI